MSSNLGDVLGDEFDAEQHEQLGDFTPIPVGEYEAQITNSDVKMTSTGGKRIALEWTILSGEYAGRIIFDNVNIVNANPKAEEIGKKQLSSICHATGQMRLLDSSELHDKPCRIKVKIRPAKGEYEAQNAITKYSPLNAPPESAAPTATEPTKHAPTKPSPAKTQSPPWSSAR